jgi:hypothetical protein
MNLKFRTVAGRKHTLEQKILRLTGCKPINRSHATARRMESSRLFQAFS